MFPILRASARSQYLLPCLGVSVFLLFAGMLRAQEDSPPAVEETPYTVDDWKEAGQDDQNGVRFRSCTITIGEDGILTGTIFRIDETTRERKPIKEIELRLVQDGKALEMTTPSEEDGEFQFGPVQPGIYSLIGQGADGLVAYSFHVESPVDPEKKDENAAEPEADQTSLDNPLTEESAERNESAPKVRLINSCAMNPADVPMALELIEAFLGVDTGAKAEEPVLDEAMEEALDRENSVSSDEESMDAPAVKSPLAGSFKAHHEDDEVQTTALSWHAVNLQEDGSLIGRVRILIAVDDEDEALQTRPPKDMRVFLIQEGRVISKATCSPRGIFVMPDLPVGLYSFVCVGLDGFAAMTVDVLPAEKKPEEENGGIRSASLRRVGFVLNNNSLPNFDTAAVPPGDFGQLQTTPLITNNVPTDNTGLGPLLTGLNSEAGSNSPPPGAGGAFAPVTGGPSGVGTPGGGGFGGGVAGGGNGRGGGGNGVPEIDPASSGAALSVLIALFFLLIDLYRPREAKAK